MMSVCNTDGQTSGVDKWDVNMRAAQKSSSLLSAGVVICPLPSGSCSNFQFNSSGNYPVYRKQCQCCISCIMLTPLECIKSVNLANASINTAL